MNSIQLVNHTFDNNTLEERVRSHTQSIVQGTCISALREANGLSRQDLANKIGVSVQTIIGYEKDVCKLSFDRFAQMLILLSPDENIQSQYESLFRELNGIVARIIVSKK